ncbi:MAG TPA: cation:proton antiporter [Hyphomicrobiaceae bacterium]|jgi:Kef-type K+ transport system membrane component KefB
MPTDNTVTIFTAELILLLFVGRALGEVLSRMGQPAVFGQLLGGVILGPSVFGALLPDLHQSIFPGTPTLKSMVDAVSQIGILLLLLLTGLETNLALVNRRRRAVVSTSLAGIAIPFVCGIALAYALPATLIPDPARHLVTALFLGTALSISSVKIVAMTLMEVGAIRRDLGQLILATAILDDTIAWVLIAVIGGIAAHGAVSLVEVGASIAGTLAFLVISLTVGRRAVAWLIRWSNDNLTIEVPVITAILLIMLVLALSTELIGVHTALGAFVAGLLIGQSPILTEHIESQLRSFIIAFFSPIFFAVAGLGMDLRTLFDPNLLALTGAMIAVATIGKFLGAATGGHLGGLTWLESTALATGLNARGSTEVVIAAIGLSMGALNDQLYTMIVAMAVVTTMIMPPTLRWVMGRVPLRDEERRRLEKEEAEETEIVPKMERVLVAVDGSANGVLAAHLAGLFVARQRILTTVLDVSPRSQRDAGAESPAVRWVRDTVESAVARAAPAADADAASSAVHIDQLIQGKVSDDKDTPAKEAAKGYSIAFVGLNRPLTPAAHRFEPHLDRLLGSFDGPVAITFNGGGWGNPRPLRILVPTAGAAHARMAAEIALALARATDGSITAFHVFDPQEDTDMLRGRLRRGLGVSVLRDVRRLAKRSEVPVEVQTAIHSRPELAIRRVAASAKFDLVVVGASLRVGERKFFGPRTASLVQDVEKPLLVVAQ